MTKPIYALSIKQPWAWLIASGYKDIENRGWSKEVRGKIYIHASKAADTKEGFKAAGDILRQVYGEPKALQIIQAYLESPTGSLCGGAIIGSVEIIDCVTQSSSPWFVGKYGYRISNAVLYGSPIPCRGQLGFFRPNKTEIAEKTK